MSDSETPDFHVVPANNNCSDQTPVIINPNPGSAVSNASNSVTNINDQHAVNSQYDNVDPSSIQPMYGGTQQKFQVIFKDKTFTIISNDPLKAVNEALHNRLFKRDYLVDVYFQNKLLAKYIKRRNHKSKYEKIF